MKVLKRIELVGSIEVFIVFPMAAFNLAVVAGSKGFNELMMDAKLF